MHRYDGVICMVCQYQLHKEACDHLLQQPYAKRGHGRQCSFVDTGMYAQNNLPGAWVEE